jgi:cytochrome c-type biogenesis protein CcmF
VARREQRGTAQPPVGPGAWIGAATLVVAVLLGAREIANTLAFALGAFALASIARSVHVGVRARRRATGEAIPTATVGAVRGNPRLYGGLLVHVGVVVIAVALAASAGYTTRREVRLARGESATVRGYTVTYLGTETERSDQKTSVKANIRIKGIGVYAPAISTYPNFANGIGTPSVHSGPWRDVYLTLVQLPADDGRITLVVQVGVMVVWLWVGGVIMALGVLLALVPARRRSVVPGTATPAHADDEPALAEVAP